MDRDEVLEFLGGDDWSEVVDEFGGMLPDEIEAHLGSIFPGEDGLGELAGAIYRALEHGDESSGDNG